MDFEFSHTFGAPALAVADVTLDADFQASLHDVAGLKSRELLSQEEAADGTVTRRVRCVSDVTIAGAARRFIGDGEPEWIEEATWHPERLTWDWVIVPKIAKELLSSEGTIRYQDHGASGSRIVAGRVTVRVPFYGGKVEGWIVDGVRRAYDDEAERLEQWLRRAGTAAG